MGTPSQRPLSPAPMDKRGPDSLRGVIMGFLRSWLTLHHVPGVHTEHALTVFHPFPDDDALCACCARGRSAMPPPLVFRPGERLGLAVGRPLGRSRGHRQGREETHHGSGAATRLADFSEHVWAPSRGSVYAYAGVHAYPLERGPLFCHPSLSPFSCIWHSACGSHRPGRRTARGPTTERVCGPTLEDGEPLPRGDVLSQLLDQQGCCAAGGQGRHVGLHVVRGHARPFQ